MTGVRFALRAAAFADLPTVVALARPFVARGDLLPRTPDEISLLLPEGFIAEAGGRAVGFAALELYSNKLSEIQSLAYEETTRGGAIARRLVRGCTERAHQRGVLEVLAIVPPLLEETFQACGFRIALPSQKRAMFVRARQAQTVDQRPVPELRAGIRIREATVHDLGEIMEFTAPFVARGELVRRSIKEMSTLLRHAFVAKDEGRIAGLAALEIYSTKLAEIQCLSVDAACRGQGIGKRLVGLCVRRAREFRVAETMAISSRDAFLKACGFEYGLPGLKTALFYHTRNP